MIEIYFMRRRCGYWPVRHPPGLAQLRRHYRDHLARHRAPEMAFLPPPRLRSATLTRRRCQPRPRE